MSEKPIHVKPSFYAYLYEPLKIKAKELGYNLMMHGSLRRDFDLVAVPWVDEPAEDTKLISEFEMIINGIQHADPKQCIFSIQPGGRKSYVINVNRGGHFNGYLDHQFYVDISITMASTESTDLLTQRENLIMINKFIDMKPTGKDYQMFATTESFVLMEQSSSGKLYVSYEIDRLPITTHYDQLTELVNNHIPW